MSMLDFFRVPPLREAELQACCEAAGLTPDQIRWRAATNGRDRRCQIVWMTPAQYDALMTALAPKEETP